MARVVERTPLCAPISPKQTYHITLNLEGFNQHYHVGDSFGIYPENDPDEVEKILWTLSLTGTEPVTDRKGNPHLLREFLLKKASLDTVTQKLYAFSSGELKDDPQALKFYLQERHVWDFLEETKVSLSAQQLAESLLPLMPRFYSVASSQLTHPHRVDLTVADLQFTTNGHLRRGVCSQYLCHKIALGDKVPVFHQAAHAFALTSDLQAPLIMIGPGTGVAPYRGFMQERVHLNASKENWLFFGERHEQENFYYQTYWKQLESQGYLRLTTAFSRDQAHKIYVQHRMKEHGQELFNWLQRGAYLYVCGDMKRMAKDVEAVLLEILSDNGVDPKAYLKELRHSKRYQRDVY